MEHAGCLLLPWVLSLQQRCSPSVRKLISMGACESLTQTFVSTGAGRALQPTCPELDFGVNHPSKDNDRLLSEIFCKASQAQR